MFEPDSDGSWKPHQHPAYTTEYPTREEWPLCSGGAGLTSTAMDYARFLQMVLDRGAIPGGRLLEEATIDTILADHAPGLVDGDWHQGLAFGVRKEPEGQGRFFWGGYFFCSGGPATGVVLLMKQTYGAKTTAPPRPSAPCSDADAPVVNGPGSDRACAVRASGGVLRHAVASLPLVQRLGIVHGHGGWPLGVDILPALASMPM